VKQDHVCEISSDKDSDEDVENHKSDDSNSVSINYTFRYLYVYSNNYRITVSRTTGIKMAKGINVPVKIEKELTNPEQ